VERPSPERQALQAQQGPLAQRVLAVQQASVELEARLVARA